MLTIRKHKCAVVLALSALAATIIVDANFIADSLTSSSTQEDNGDNLLQNGGFEESDSGWECELCTQKSSRNSDSHSGAYSYQVISSESGKPTLNQKLSVTPGTRYVLGGYVKLKELPSGKIFQRLELHVRFYRSKELPQPPKQTCADQIEFCHFIPNVCADLTAARTICKKICNICDNDLVFVSTLPLVQPEFGWQEIGGDIMIPSDVTRMSVYFTFYGPSGNFLVDDVIVAKLSDNVNWKKMADARIEKYRKSDINIKIHGGNPQDQDLRIKIEQKSHDYPFGTAVNTEAMLNSSLRKYQDFVYKNFNWAVLENALKWSKTEEKQGVITTGKQVKALKKLKKRGISVRGHAVFWDVLVWGVQPWVASLTKDQLTDAMNRRYDIVKVTKGKVKHWDVNNENLHGDFYETKLQNANITMDMFRKVHSIDPDVNLFLNDFDIVLKTSHRTVAVKNQGKRLHESGVPIHGIGIQSHLRDGDVDITAIKHRLDKVAEAGLPVWITELSYNHPDEMKRAEGYEDVFRLYFSHPAIEGILIWGYWDKMIFQIDAAIATGPNVVPNEAGRRILNLLKKEWWTNMTLDLSSNHHALRGFHGNYEVTVLKNGKKVAKKSFALPKSRKTIDIHLHITEGFHLDIC